MGKFLTILTILSLALGGAFTSCNSGGCTELRSSVPRADFFSSSTNSKIILDSLRISGIGVPGDSALYGPKERISSVYLPMPALTDKVQWRIAYMQKHLQELGFADTLTIAFERTPWFAGEECGAMYKYRITNLETTKNLIDSVILVDSLVVNLDNPTMNIYFRTSSQQ